MKEVCVVLSSEDSVQIQFPQKISEEVNAQVTSFVKKMKKCIVQDISNAGTSCTVSSAIIEIVPTYCAVTVYFDPEKADAPEVITFIKKILSKNDGDDEEDVTGGKLVEIPVCYDDEEFAPDLEDVAKHTGLTKEEVIKIHHSKDYLIYMLGFLPGFPYLGGMDERLETPRLETPRTKIPAGSVAIGGKQAGLYPSDSPGGWRIIGRTPLKVFDQNRSPSCLYEAGDRIRFVPITRAKYDEIAAGGEFGRKSGASSCGEVVSRGGASSDGGKYICTSGIKIIEGGMLTTVQDKGRFGFLHTGIGQSGVMDMESFLLGNAILENTENAACLEATVLGPSIKFTLACQFVITGAECSATLDDEPVMMNQKYLAKEGSVLKCGFITKGLRSYICFEGGILVPKLFESRSTNLKSKTGGFFGRKLQAGDELAIGYEPGINAKKTRRDEVKTGAPLAGRNPLSAEDATPDSIPSQDSILTLTCTTGSQYSYFPEWAVKKFQSEVFTVLPESDRMGIRFSGQGLECGKTDIISDAIPFGAVQITSAGLPVVMAADRQTTGGYAKIACVTSHSMCRLAQAVPGTKVMFKII